MTAMHSGSGHTVRMLFEALPIHDAALTAIHVGYEAARCELVLRVVGGASWLLVFDGIRAVSLPREQPWGPSHAINVARQVDAQAYEIELQSGDVLRVEAAHWRFHEHQQ